MFDSAQGWILVAIIGFIVACVAFFVDVTENVLFDYKDGYCTSMLLSEPDVDIANRVCLRCLVLQQKEVLSQ